MPNFWERAGPPCGRELLLRFTVCSLCILTYCNFSYLPLLVFNNEKFRSFKSKLLIVILVIYHLVLIASVPGHCLHFTLSLSLSLSLSYISKFDV